MEKTFEVKIREILETTIEFTASSEQEALAMAEEEYNNEEIVLDSGDFVSKEIFREKEGIGLDKKFVFVLRSKGTGAEKRSKEYSLKLMLENCVDENSVVYDGCSECKKDFKDGECLECDEFEIINIEEV